MKILVTGGAGFIGSNLCDYLFLNHHQLIVVDDLSTGKMSNLSSVIEGIEFHKSTVEDFDFSACSDADVIVHLAAQRSVSLSISEFKSSSGSNLLATISVIDYCRENAIPLVYASSSAIYGELDIGDDESRQLDLLSPYAIDKYCMELYATLANQLFQLSNIGLRFFNVYGPRQDTTSQYSGVISIFLDRLLRKDSIIINGGHQIRDFIFIDDVIDCINKSIELVTSSGQICEQINVLTGKVISIDQLANILSNQLNYIPERIYKDLEKGDPKKSSGTTDKMIRILDIDIAKMISIDKGLENTVAFLKSEGHE